MKRFGLSVPAVYSLWFFCVYLAVPSAFAQEGAPARLRLRSFLLQGDEAQMLHFWDGEEMKSQRASLIQPSGELVLPYRSPLPVFREGELPEDGSAPTPMDRVDLPEGVERVLLLVRKTEEGFSFFAMEDSLHSADERDWMFFNMSARPVAFMIGEGTEPVMLPPRSHFTHRVNPQAGGGTPVMAAARFEGDVKTFYSTYWPMQAKRRTLVLLAPQGDGIQVRRIVERLPQDRDE